MPDAQPTSTQVRILRHLRQAEEDGRQPSYREMAESLGWKAVATVRDHVVALEAKGLLTLEPRQARSLRLTKAGRAASGAAPARPLAKPDPALTLATAAQEVMDLLAPWLRPRSYAKGAILWHEGDQADRLVIVDGGRLRAFRQLADGRTAMVLQFGAGEVLGFSPFFDEGGYPATVEVLEAAMIRYVIRQDLVSAMREPRIAMTLLGLLARRLRKAFDTIEQLSLHRALPRVATALQALMKDAEYRFLTLPQSAKAFAEALGLAEATLSRTLGQLVELGILHRLGPRRYQVLQAEELGRLALGEQSAGR